MEPLRYAQLAAPDTASPWLLVLGIWPALVYLAWRNVRAGAVGDRLLLASVVCFAGLLALLEGTKTQLYTILLLPSLCMCLALGVVQLVRWSVRIGRHVATGVCAVMVVVAIALALDSVRAFQAEWQAADEVTAYVAIGKQLAAAIPPGASTLGPERWWWALRDHPYLSLRGIWFEWTALAESGAGVQPRFADWVARARAQAIVVNINVRDDIQAFPEPLQEQFWDFLDRCTTETAAVPSLNYFETDVYLVNDGCA
jgi:hypothetical protein